MAHQASVYRIAESHANAQQGMFLAILYDELARQSWSHRAARGDAALDVLKEASTPAPDLVAAAQSRLQTVLRQAGISEAVQPSPGLTTGDVG